MSCTDQLHQASEELRVLSKIIKNVSGKVQVDEFLQEIVEDARLYIGVEALNIGLVSSVANCLEPLWVTGISPKLARKNFPRISLDNRDDIAIKCLNEKKMAVVANVPENADVHDDIKLLAAGMSFVLMPLIIDDSAIGVVGFSNNLSRREIDSETIQRYQRFVDTLAMFFNNSRIYAELESLRQNLEEQVAERTVQLKQAHETIWEINENLFAIIENSTVGIIATDPGGTIRVFNRAAADILNTRLDRLAAPRIALLLPENLEQKLFAAPCQSAGEFGVLFRNYETELKRGEAATPEDGLVPVSLSAVRLKNREGLVSGYVFVFQDIREVRFLEAKLIEAEKLRMIGQMAAGISHELNTPIGMIRASSAVIKQNLVGGQDIIARHVGFINDAVGRASSFIREFLDLARPAKPFLQKTEVAEILNRAVELFRLKSHSGKIDLAVKLEEPLLPIYGDVNRLIQVFINLFDNAVDAMGGSGEIAIRAFCREIEPADTVPDNDLERRAGDPDGSRLRNFRKFHLHDPSKMPPLFEAGDRLIQFEVSDAGPGLSPGLIEQVCEPFFSTKAGNGCGLGLTICQRIIREHCGCLNLVSPPGKGVTAIIRLPVYSTMVRFERMTL